jgi:ribonuclease G
MTRQRIRVSLLDSMSEECPTCQGSGRIISRETLLTRIEHWLRRYKSKHRDLRIRLQLHKEIAEFITNDERNILRGLMWKNFVHIKIEINKDIGRDEFKFIKTRSGEDITNEMSLDKDNSIA